MPRIPSPDEYVSNDSQCDTCLTSDAELGSSDAPLFPAWHRARRLNGLSDVALCKQLSQLRAYSAFSQQTAAEQLSILESNPYFQELRSRQRRRKQHLWESRRPKPPKQQIAESDTLSASESSGVRVPTIHGSTPERICTPPQPRNGGTGFGQLVDYVHMGRDIPAFLTSDESMADGSAADAYTRASGSGSEASDSLSAMVSKIFSSPATVPSEVSSGDSTSDCSAAVPYVSASDGGPSSSDSALYTCKWGLCGCSFTDRTEFREHMQVHDDTSDEEPVAKQPMIIDSSSEEEEELSNNPVIEWRSMSQRLKELVRRTNACDGGLLCPHSRCHVVSVGDKALRHHVTKEHPSLPIESRIGEEMTKWGLTVATSVIMPASRGGWLTDTSRVYSMVDIIVMDVTSCTF
ncbi:unnamed protein product [Ectocarpus sp. 8 AP-2014]